MYAKELISYTIAFVLVTLLGVYGLNMPGLISGQPELVKEYYHLNWKFYLPMDYFLVMVYLLAAYYLAKKMGVKSQATYLLVLLGTTALISGSFWAYFSSGPMTSSFFSQWFHKAGFKAVIYDLTLLTLMYLVYVGIMKLF